VTRFVSSLLLIVLCLIAFALWQLNIYPFTDPVFAYDGYGLHVFGGIGYTAFQILAVRLCFPQLAFTTRFFAVQGAAAFMFLLALELLQFDDPFRHVQVEDIVAQTLGITAALLILSVRERQRNA
jgi:hypothetical protein